MLLHRPFLSGGWLDFTRIRQQTLRGHTASGQVTKVGVLQPFRVTAMNEARRNVVLADARAQAQQRRALEARRRPPLQQGYGGGGGGYRYRLS